MNLRNVLFCCCWCSAHRRSTATPPHLSGSYQLQVYHIDGSSVDSNGTQFHQSQLQQQHQLPHQHQHQSNGAQLQFQQAQDFAAWSYGTANHRTPIYATSPRPPKDVTTTTSTYSGNFEKDHFKLIHFELCRQLKKYLVNLSQ